MFHPDPHFVLEPVPGNGTRAIADTLEQDWKGGLVVKLGLEDFLAVVSRTESLLLACG